MQSTAHAINSMQAQPMQLTAPVQSTDLKVPLQAGVRGCTGLEWQMAEHHHTLLCGTGFLCEVNVGEDGCSTLDLFCDTLWIMEGQEAEHHHTLLRGTGLH